jgi:prepilin-type N-terminal cleavage/methylation domain-containing protein/prepilin-type processing-associated H-X9-DG protein
MLNREGALPMRRAFTLVELLVVIAVMGILIALLLPAVQAAREAARRSQCANNLKQLGLGLLSYHDAQRTYPSGYLSNFDSSGNDTGPGWGWAAELLPQIEQGALYATINFNLAIEHKANLPARMQAIPTLLCPSDEVEPFWSAETRDAAGNVTSVICQIASANYVAVYGTSDPGVDGDGMFFRNSGVNLRDITDGSSNTIALGERSHLLGEAAWAGSVTGTGLYPDASEGEIGARRWEAGSGMVLGHVGLGNGPNSPNSEVNQFYSLHGQGVDFVFADGHARFIPATIDYQVYRAMATIAGGEPASGDF